MGHAAYHRGSNAIAAHIKQRLDAEKKPDAWVLLEAEMRREKARADKAEAKLYETEKILSNARRSVGILRGTLECEREERRAEVENWKFKAQFAAKALARSRAGA